MDDPHVISLAQAHPDLRALLKEVSQSTEPHLLAIHTEPVAVLLSMQAYNALLDRLEDLEDSLDILQARASNEPSRPFEGFIQEFEAST